MDAVHEEADELLQQVEESGLTRLEILYNETKGGILLKDDPFF